MVENSHTEKKDLLTFSRAPQHNILLRSSPPTILWVANHMVGGQSQITWFFKEETHTNDPYPSNVYTTTLGQLENLAFTLFAKMLESHCISPFNCFD